MISKPSPRKIGFAKRLLSSVLGTTTISVALTFGSAFAVEHNSHSAPHRTVGCEDGNCQPRSASFGHYSPSWRKWPEARAIYEGFRSAEEGVSSEEDQLPEPRDEIRFERRTRSSRPLDPEPPGLLDDVIPSSTDETDPNNPFNQLVPETDLPGAGGDNGAGDAGGGFGGFDNPAEGGFDNPAGGGFDNPAAGGFGNPADGGGFDAGGGFGGDGAAPPAGGGNTGGLGDSLLPDPGTTTPDGGGDDGLFELPGGDEEGVQDLFGPGARRSPSDQKLLINIGPVRFIKNRPSPLSRAQKASKSTSRPKPIHVVQAQALSVPGLGVAGLVQDEPSGGSLLMGGFTENDLVSARSTNSKSDPAVGRVSYEEPMQSPSSKAEGVVYEETSNPLRPRVVKSSQEPLTSAKLPSKGKLVPELDVALLPVPSTDKGSGTEEHKPADLVTQIPALESELSKSANVKEQQSRQDGSRGLVAMNKRSLRDTLRKNPLRR